MNDIKSALVVGGSRGIGEALVAQLLSNGCSQVIVADRARPLHSHESVKWIEIDLSNGNVEMLREYVSQVDCLIITAGIGRLNNFDTFDSKEIQTTLSVNSLAPIKLLNMCSGRLTGSSDFFVLALTSIAGLISSPLYAVYSASKAALSRYIESVNAELAGRNLINRITEIAPGRIEGTCFHGKQQSNPDSLAPLAQTMLEAMTARCTRMIPDASTYKEVVERYQKNPIEFGLSSYSYKLEHAQLEEKRAYIIGYLSGTFDLFHVGHLNLLKRARNQCDHLVVGVHTDGAWKGKQTFISLEERKAIIAACKYVDEVIDAPDEDSDAWESVRYNRLFVGSDYKGTERFDRYEAELGALGVEIVYFPYTTTTSSSQIRSAISKELQK